MKTKIKQGTNKNKKLKKDAKKETEDKKNQENITLTEEKDKKKKRTLVKMNKCEFCQNPIPDPKKTLNFSCQHQLCGVCISHCIFRDNFNCITERNDLITLCCNECLKRKSLELGYAQVSISFILSVLKDTYKIRDKKQKDICLTHQQPAEYCKECKKWICEECRTSFHDNNFPNHSAYASEEPFSFKKCVKHGDKGLELFCDDCGIDICSSCALKGGEHSTHNVISLVELKRRIVHGKKKYKFQKFEEFDDVLQYMHNDFKNKFEESYKRKSDLISEITTLLQNFYDKFFSFKTKMTNFIENYFKIIRACYFNYFKDIEEKEPRMNSIEFIDSVDREISHFDFDSKSTKELENIKDELEKIDPKKFFEYKLRFLNHSFKCINSMKDSKIEELKDKKHPKEKKFKEIMNQIYCLVQLKNGNVLTGGSQGVLTLWDIKAGKKIETIKAHKGNIYSVIELDDGRFASSGRDSFINIWDLKGESDSNFEPKYIDIIQKEPLKKEPNIALIKDSESNNKKIDNDTINIDVNINNINKDITSINNNNINKDITSINNNIKNINEINTTNFAPFKTNNETMDLNANLYNPFKLNKPQNTSIVPQNENKELNQNPQINNINLGTTNQQIIKIDSNMADTGYSGNGVHNDLPKNLGYGSSAIGQNNNLNNENNININSTMFPQNHGINTNQINSEINKDITNNDINKENNNFGLINETTKIDANINKSDTVSTNQFLNIVQNEMKNLELNNNNNNNINNNNQTSTHFMNNNNNNQTNTLFMNNTYNNMPTNTFAMNNNNNINSINNNIDNNATGNNNNNNPPTNQQPKPEEKKDEEESKYDDFFEDVKDSTIKPNPPKKPDELEEEKPDDKINYICKMKLHGHSSDVNCIFETSQNKLISCGKDGYILIWTLDEKEKPIKIFGHKNGVGCGIELKENTIITGGGDKVLKIWDLNIIDMQKPDVTLKGHTNAIFSICKINENKIASASCDKSIRIWDLDNYICYQIFEGHSGFIWSLVNVEINFGNKGETKKLLASASSDKTIKFWDLDENRCYKTIVAHDKEITTLANLKDGNLISGSLDSTIKIWKL